MRWGRCVRYMAQWHTSIIKKRGYYYKRKRGCPKWHTLFSNLMYLI